MLATTGLPFSLRARESSRQIRSEALPSPPGESIRTTIAFTDGSSARRWMRRGIDSEPAIQEAPELLLVEVPRLGDAPHVAAEDVVQKSVHHLTLLARHVPAGEDVGRVLVGADADELRLHTELVEARAGEERRRGETV